MDGDDWKAVLAEGIATFALVFIGAGVVLANRGSDEVIGLTGIALAHGVVLMSMIYAVGHISGGHVNPAVTLGMWITKQIGSLKALAYMAAQFAGAVIAAFLLKVIFVTRVTGVQLGTPQLGNGVTIWTGILTEAILTFFLVFVIFGVAVDKRAPQKVAGLAIGLVLTFDILMGGTLTGGAMNPARWFGPALAAGYWGNWMVYIVGPVIGGLLAALLYTNVFMEREVPAYRKIVRKR